MEVSDKNRATVDAYSVLSDDFYDGLGEDGGFIRRALLNPGILHLLGDVSGKHILDAGCGHGYLSRLLARRGALLIGVESATVPFEYAARREEVEPLGIRYLQRDLSRLGDLEVAFDAVVANMVLLDIPDWRPALQNCVAELRPAARSCTRSTTPAGSPETSKSGLHAAQLRSPSISTSTSRTSKGRPQLSPTALDVHQRDDPPRL